MYAALGGIPFARAVAEIAAHLGLIESDPATWDARRAERQQAEAAKRAAALAESWRLTKLAAEAHRLEREAESLRSWASRLPKHLALRVIVAAIERESRVMECDYLGGWA